MRQNADNVFVLGSIGSQVIQSLYEEYSPSVDGVTVDRWHDLREIYDKASEGHGCLVIDNAQNGNLHAIRAPAEPAAFQIAQARAKAPAKTKAR
jgi:hypothetical protein